MIKSMAFRALIFSLLVAVLIATKQQAEAKVYMAYISDAPDSSVLYWVAKEAGIFKKHGLDVELIFINGSVRGIQSLIAADLSFTGAVGTAAINARLAGGGYSYHQ